MSKLLKEVRRIENLYSAWRKVRTNIITSGSEKFRAEIQDIDDNPIKYIRRIQRDLQLNRFKFDPQYGRVKDGRPLIVASIKNRLVQRAILNVLQSDNKKVLPLLGKIPNALTTPTSIGGIQKRGVAYGMDLLKTSISDGMSYYLKSDIKKFFTKVPKEVVVKFIRQETNDDAFATLFREALVTELENEEGVKGLIRLFPISDTGIPQGSSLSALAGNIVLADFDGALNSRGIITYRYIDDFVMLGTSSSSLKKAFQAGLLILEKLGMDAYDPDDETDKASSGNIKSGFNFLGCRVEEGNISAGQKARDKLLTDIKESLKYSQRDLEHLYDISATRRAEAAFIQSLVKVDRKIRGWGDAFDFTNNRLPMVRLDEKLDDLINNFAGENLRRMRSLNKRQKRRVFGISLLADTPHRK